MIADKQIQEYISKSNVSEVLRHFALDFFKKHLSKKYELKLITTTSIFMNVYEYGTLKLYFSNGYLDDATNGYFDSVRIKGFGAVSEEILYVYEYFDAMGLQLIDLKRKEVAYKVIEQLEKEKDVKLKEIESLNSLANKFCRYL